MRRYANALLGFAAGVVALPVVVIAAPFALAWWCYNETEGDGK